MESSWGSTTPLFVSTSALFRFSKKLKALKPDLRAMGKEHLGDLYGRTKDVHAKLCERQTETLINPTAQNMAEESLALSNCQHLADLEEGFLKQKSKLRWLWSCQLGCPHPNGHVQADKCFLRSKMVMSINDRVQ